MTDRKENGQNKEWKPTIIANLNPLIARNLFYPLSPSFSLPPLSLAVFSPSFSG
jgi:hypothetical protein